ncbi:MAG: histone [bacterium]|nr:histone [bacterium]
MTRKTSTIPKATVARIMINAGAKRVSAGAINAFAAILTERAEKIAEKAAEIAKHSGRKTIQEGDIKIARK